LTAQNMKSTPPPFILNDIHIPTTYFSILYIDWEQNGSIAQLLRNPRGLTHGKREYHIFLTLQTIDDMSNFMTWVKHEIVPWQRSTLLSDDLQYKGCREIRLVVTNSTIVFGERCQGTVKTNLNTKAQTFCTNRSRAVKQRCRRHTNSTVQCNFLIEVLQIKLSDSNIYCIYIYLNCRFLMHHIKRYSSTLKKVGHIKKSQLNRMFLQEVQIKNIVTLPDLWSGILKLKEGFKPAIASFTVTVVEPGEQIINHK
jgi:hypothetical protein